MFRENRCNSDFDNQRSSESKVVFAVSEDKFGIVNVVIQCVHTVKALIN